VLGVFGVGGVFDLGILLSYVLLFLCNRT